MSDQLSTILIPSLTVPVTTGSLPGQLIGHLMLVEVTSTAIYSVRFREQITFDFGMKPEPLIVITSF